MITKPIAASTGITGATVTHDGYTNDVKLPVAIATITTASPKRPVTTRVRIGMRLRGRIATTSRPIPVTRMNVSYSLHISRAPRQAPSRTDWNACPNDCSSAGVSVRKTCAFERVSSSGKISWFSTSSGANASIASWAPITGVM